MIRLDQLQNYATQKGLVRAIAFNMGYRHLDWISKDTDMQAAHWQKYQVSWAVPDGPFDLDNWAKSIALALEGEEAYAEYNPTLSDEKGLILIYGWRFHPDAALPSGWRVVYQYTYIDPTMALM